MTTHLLLRGFLITGFLCMLLSQCVYVLEENSTTTYECSDDTFYGIHVTVTNKDEIGLNAEVSITDQDGYYEELTSLETGVYFGAEERAGTYTLQIVKEGFESDTRSVLVEENECHVIPTKLSIILLELK